MKHLLLILTLCGLIPSLLMAETAPRPNILYLYVDDMGWGSIGPNGQAARRAAGLPHVLTPTLDRLAAEGINFTRAYGCTVCSPARSSQQSGFHQGHTWADRNDPNNAKKAMRAEDVLLGDALSAAGYVTGYWGKWGYGSSRDRNEPVILNLQTLPTSHGYTYCLTELHHVRAHTFFQPTLWSSPAAPGAIGGMELVPNSMAPYIGNPAYPDDPARQNHVDYPSPGYCDDAYAFAALDFVRTQARNYNATGQPFFGLLAVQVPHAPYADIARLPEWDEAYATNAPFATLSAQARQWAAMVTRMDAHFGTILGALDDPNHDGDTADSVAENTLVVFMSDNGGPNNNARAELNANGGLRGSKTSIYEGGIRVPAIARWPVRIHGTSSLAAGTDTHAVIDVTDMLPTFCELAGIEVPAGIDGVSLAPLLTGSGHQRPREFIIHEARPDYSIIRGNHKLVGPSWALYDLDADPAESMNIVSAHPELAAELQTLLLGERVSERDDFANTYHRWTGGDGAVTSDPDHWSDYVYANDGVTYHTDAGPPRVSWNAVMETTGTVSATAVADADLAFLGLAIRGASAAALQTLDLNARTLHGRNEIRLAAHSVVRIDNGTLESLRWVDLKREAAIVGTGQVNAALYHAGHLAITPGTGTTVPGDRTRRASIDDVSLVRDGAQVEAPGLRSITVAGRYRATDTATLELTLGGTRDDAQLRVAEDATLAGSIVVTIDPEYTPRPGDLYTVLTADAVTGTFDHPDPRITASDGTHFMIAYAPTSVTLTAVGTTTRGMPHD